MSKLSVITRFSCKHNVTSGVLQGSILGPILFPQLLMILAEFLLPERKLRKYCNRVYPVNGYFFSMFHGFKSMENNLLFPYVCVFVCQSICLLDVCVDFC